MSRTTFLNDNGTRTLKVDLTECSWLFDEVCTNPRCDCCCDYPDPDEYCKKCPFFDKERP